jgi:hypothetical protein
MTELKQICAFGYLFLVLSIFTSENAFAKEGLHSKRPADQIANYKIFGISLSMKPEQAINALEDQGFVLSASNLQPGMSSWQFKKDKTFVRIEESRSSEWDGLGKIFVRQNYADKLFDVAEQAEKIVQSWSENDDGKPVCLTGKGNRGDRVVQAACAVNDPEEKQFVFYATLNVVQIDMGLSLNKQVVY